MSSSDEKIIQDAQKLYNKGEWAKAIDLIDMILTSNDEQQIAEANRIKGWSYYYLAIKGDKSLKAEKLEKAEECFRLALIKISEEKGLISILNGLPLVLWILERKQEALKLSDEVTEEFPNIPSVWNTKSILSRWGKDFQNSVEICEKVYETAIAKKDFRTAGHGKQNKADCFIELNQKEQAKKDYIEAIKMYKKHEERTGESTRFHLERVQKKLSNL